LNEPFAFLSGEHLWGLFACAAVVAALIVFRAALRRPVPNRIARYTLAAALIGSELALYGSYTVRDAWGWYALPFQLCTLMVWVSAYSVAARSQRAYEVSFFLGILGAMQALATPYLTVGFPDFRYFHFFLAHIAIIAASVFLTAVDGFRPTAKSVFKALLWLNAFAGAAGIVNAATGENFMFVARKPQTGSLLDVLAPWPWYLLQLEAIAFALCVGLLGVVRGIDRIAAHKK